MDQLLEKIKCACPHDCSDDCLYCTTKYEFILETPVPLKCGHCICQNCELKTESKKELKCIFCKSKSSDNIVQKENNVPKAFDDILNSLIEISMEVNNQKLQEKLKEIGGNLKFKTRKKLIIYLF